MRKLAPILNRLTQRTKFPSLSPQLLRLYSADVAPPKDPSNKFTFPSSYNPFGPIPPPSQKILDLADQIASLSPQEIKQIGPALLVKLNQPLPQTMSSQGFTPQASGAGKGEEKKKEEKTAFDVKLEKFEAASKIKVIKEVRSFTNLGLKEAKELVEKAPSVLKQGVTKEEANEIIEKIKAVGGTAVME